MQVNALKGLKSFFSFKITCSIFQYPFHETKKTSVWFWHLILVLNDISIEFSTETSSPADYLRSFELTQHTEFGLLLNNFFSKQKSLQFDWKHTESHQFCVLLASSRKNRRKRTKCPMWLLPWFGPTHKLRNTRNRNSEKRFCDLSVKSDVSNITFKLKNSQKSIFQ